MGLAYERLGSGPPLVLLHGIGHRRQAWSAVLNRLAPHRDLIVADLPGHGESPPLDTARRSVPRALLEQTTGLLDELGLQRPHLAGSSLGGLIALELAVGGRAASVTALSPAGFWTTDRELRYAVAMSEIMEVAGRLIRPFGPALARTTAGRALIYAAVVAKPSRVSPEQARGDMSAFLDASGTVREILAAAVPFTGTVPLDVPVTIAWGIRDHLLPPRQAARAKALLPQARVIPLPGCGHVPMTDDPDLVATVLLQGSRVGLPARRKTTSAGLTRYGRGRRKAGAVERGGPDERASARRARRARTRPWTGLRACRRAARRSYRLRP